MLLFPEISAIVTGIACLCFTGFFAVLIIPNLFMSFFYLAPKTLGYIFSKKLQGSAFWSLIKKPLILLLFFGFLLSIAFILDFETGKYLTMSPPAIACWLLAIPATLRILVTKRKDILSRYYTGIYMEYLTESEYEKFSTYIRRVDSCSIGEAKEALETETLSFLEKKALLERILLLQGIDVEKR